MKARPTVFAAAAVCATLVLAACSSGSSSSDDPKADKDLAAIAAECADKYEGPLSDVETSYPEPTSGHLKIGFLQPLGAQESVAYIQKFVEAEVAKLGGETVAFDAEGQPDKQVTQMEQLLNEGVDAVIAFPLDVGALEPVVAKAKAAGVPVIGVEIAPDPTGDIGDWTTQIVQGRDYQAYVHACAMAELHPGGEVATIGFAVKVTTIVAYVDRVTFWAKEFGLKVVDAVDNPSDDVAGGEEVSSGLLAKHADLAGVLAYNDASAIGARTAARTQSRTLTVFGVDGGSDAFAAIKGGQLDLSLQFPEKSWGMALVAAAYAAVQQPDVELPRVAYPEEVGILTESNIDDAMTWEQQLKADY
jgi:ribose transport system substrate-binding protein